MLFYKYLKNKLHTSNYISHLLCSITNNIVTSDDEKAVCLFRQFSYVFINNNSTSVNFPFIARPTPNINQFSNYPISHNNVRNFYVYCLINIITPLTCYQSLFKKKLSYEMCYPLSIIYTLILESGTCPSIWKKSFIIPIFKKGDPSLVVNYRPISLLPSL